MFNPLNMPTAHWKIDEPSDSRDPDFIPIQRHKLGYNFFHAYS